MSFIQFQQQCKDCKEHWNAAFGIVGMTMIAQPPEKCPKCGSKNISRFAGGWETTSAGEADDGKSSNESGS